MAASLFVIALLVGSSVGHTCHLPPSLWCSSPQTAQLCQVEEQCQSYLQPLESASKVNITMYYESLCPDCMFFISTQLHQASQEVASITNFDLVPYGNAEEKQSGEEWKFFCQHGQEECVGNIIESCAIQHLKTFENYFPFIHCFEAQLREQTPAKAAQTCGEELQIDTDTILICSKGSEGNRLEHQMAQRTNGLKPRLNYVPWITLNGVHNEMIQSKAQSHLVRLICDTYQGSDKPATCNQELQSIGCEKEHYVNLINQ